MKSKYLLAALVGLAAFATIMAGRVLFSRPYTFHGSLIDPPVPAPDFALADQHSGTFRLSAQKGRAVLLYFGYTNCPDACPAALTQFKKIRNTLGRDADSVRFVFITVDPARDTADHLRDYLAGFDPAFVGLTGEFLDLDLVYRGYGVYQAIPVPGLEYLVDHTDRFYVIDPQGNLRLTYTTDTPAADLAADIRELLK